MLYILTLTWFLILAHRVACFQATTWAVKKPEAAEAATGLRSLSVADAPHIAVAAKMGRA